MADKIFRFEITVADKVRMPDGVMRVLAVKKHRVIGKPGMLEAWATVNEDFPVPPVVLHFRGTGHDLTGNEGRFIDTVLDGPLVWHCFQADE